MPCLGPVALASHSVRAPVNLEHIAAHLHREALFDFDQQVHVYIQPFLLVPLERRAVVGLPLWMDADRLVDTLTQPRLGDLATVSQLTAA